MANIKVYNMLNEEVGSLSLNDEVFGVPYNEPLIHEVVVAQDADARQGTKSTLTRSEVRGHAKKPWKQKHTGRARHGSTKGPQWTGGGIVFAPKPRDFSKKVNKQARVGAFVSALSQKLAQDELVVVDNFVINEPKTKEIVTFQEKFNLKGNTVLVLANKDEKVLRATNNIPDFGVTTVDILNVKDIVGSSKLIFSQEAIKSIEEACGR
ncbi:MAG: 50S ribosomal protein L4 [Clostridia bacterium]